MKVYITCADNNYLWKEGTKRPNWGHPLIQEEDATIIDISWRYHASNWFEIGKDHKSEAEKDSIKHSRTLKVKRGFLIDPTYEQIIELSTHFNCPIIVNSEIYIPEKTIGIIVYNNFIE